MIGATFRPTAQFVAPAPEPGSSLFKPEQAAPLGPGSGAGTTGGDAAAERLFRQACGYCPL